MPQAAYDEYADRGESENRNKEIKCGLEGDRLSDHRYLANLFRLYLHATALNLLARLRRQVADPPPQDPTAELPRERWPGARGDSSSIAAAYAIPWAKDRPALRGMRLIKVAVRVIETTRRVVVRLSGSWPHVEDYRQISQRILDLAPRPQDSG